MKQKFTKISLHNNWNILGFLLLHLICLTILATARYPLTRFAGRSSQLKCIYEGHLGEGDVWAYQFYVSLKPRMDSHYYQYPYQLILSIVTHYQRRISALFWTHLSMWFQESEFLLQRITFYVSSMHKSLFTEGIIIFLFVRLKWCPVHSDNVAVMVTMIMLSHHTLSYVNYYTRFDFQLEIIMVVVKWDTEDVKHKIACKDVRFIFYGLSLKQPLVSKDSF